MDNAIYQNDIQKVRELITKGANLNEKDKLGYTPLHIATMCNEREIVGLLLENGADVNAKDNIGETPLHYAVIDRYDDIVVALVANGADINVKNWQNSAPLHVATLYGRSNIVQHLIDNGANINASNQFGETPLDIAEQRGYKEIVQIINKAMAEKQLAAKPPTIPLPQTPPTAKPAIPKPTVATTAGLRPITGQRWAVVIGISNYQDSRIPPLRYAHADAESFYYWLISPEGGCYSPSHVKLLTDEQATGVNIRDALFEWLKQAIDEDMVLIFFAGHGSPESPDFTNNLFLLPYDIQYDRIAATGFPMWDVKTALDRFIRAKKVVIIADACHSGGVGKEYEIARRSNRAIKVNPIVSVLQDLSKIGDGICVISGSEERQFSQEDVIWGGGHGVFTHFLLNGLDGEADYNKDKRVTLGELIPYLSEQVRRATRNAQSPTVAGKFDPALSIKK